ncbi:MAG: type II methionyl aminopeptidase [Nanoarchaeota archaeon]|nr:type II methionyl aminopeptidase [Nanoarchaeota archaeon]
MNQPKEGTIEDHKEAGRIASKVREWGKSLFKDGAKVIDIAEAVENKIRELGAEPGFPCCISINSLAAHYSPFINDQMIIHKGDIIKFDMGTHINGKVADTACTIEVESNTQTRLIQASHDALERATKIMKPGTPIRAIGKIVSDTIRQAGFQPIINLSGHGLGDYIVHDDPTIPNYDNGDETELEEGQSIACEPFATTGAGLVSDGKPCGIYGFINKKNTRLPAAREVMKIIEEKYRTLPFSCRWIKVPGIQMLLNQLEKDGILRQYTQLPEKSGGLVSQAEHSIIIGEGVITQ